MARLADRAASAAVEVVALAAPVDCICCGAEDRALCGGCERQVRLLMSTPFRAEAQAPVLMDVDGTVLLPVVAAGAYRAELAQAVLSFKRYGQGQLAQVLSKGLAAAISAAAGDARGLLLVPVPTSGGAYRKRGFSPVHVLLGRIARPRPLRTGRRPGFCAVDALRKTGRPTAIITTGQAAAAPGNMAVPGVPGPPDPAPTGGLPGRVSLLAAGAGYSLPGLWEGTGQKGLGRGGRAQRVRGSMRVRRGPFAPEVNGRPCLIIDDVLTTGATLAEAARALGRAGALVQGAVVLAATRPPATLGYGTADPAVAGQWPVNEKNKPKKDE